MDIHACGSRPSRRGPADSFTGTVWQDPIIEAPAPARIRSGMVRFEPGARTHWHTHPLGQTLAVISGCGRVQVWAVRLAKSVPAMWSGFRQAKNTGMAPVRTRSWCTSPCRKRSMESTLSGWSRSPTSNTSPLAEARVGNALRALLLAEHPGPR